MSTLEDVKFNGSDSSKCAPFLRSIREMAIKRGKSQDRRWMADIASIRLDGLALEWYEVQEDDVRYDWEKLRKGLLENFGVVEWGKLQTSSQKVETVEITEPAQASSSEKISDLPPEYVPSTSFKQGDNKVALGETWSNFAKNISKFDGNGPSYEPLSPTRFKIFDLVFHPLEHKVFLVDETSIILWDLNSNTCEWSHPHYENGEIVRFAVHSSGLHLAFGVLNNIWIRGTESFNYIGRISSEQLLASPIDQLLFQPRGTSLAAVSMNTLRVCHDYNKYTGWINFTDDQDKIYSVAFSTDGRRLISIIKDSCAIVEWDVNNGSKIRSREGSYNMKKIVLSPDGRTLAGGHAVGNLKFFNMDDGKFTSKVSTWAFGKHSGTHAFSPDGSIIAVYCGGKDSDGSFEIRLYDVASKTRFTKLNFPSRDTKNYALSFSADGTVIAMVDGTILLHLWRVPRIKN